MKKNVIPFILMLFIGSFSLQSCDLKSPEKAAAYYKNIVEDRINVLVSKKDAELMESLENYVPQEMNEKYIALEQAVLQYEKDLNEMKDYYGDASLLNAAKKVVEAYKNALPMFKELVDIESLPDDLYNDDEMETSKALENTLYETLSPLVDDFILITEKFAKENGFKLI